jgi:hypothetical protein
MIVMIFTNEQIVKSNQTNVLNIFVWMHYRCENARDFIAIGGIGQV